MNFLLLRGAPMKNFNALSLFCGSGLGETYFFSSGINTRVACELLPSRADLYRHFYPFAHTYAGDLTDQATYNSVIDMAKKEQCDFVIATPPCQGMSTAGHKMFDDPRNRLIINAIDAIIDIMPKFAIIENVPEILTTKIKIDSKWILIPDYIKKRLSKNYFINKNNIVNAMNYGVPQSRERCVFLLSRKDQGIVWEFPKPFSHIITMRESIGNLPSLDPEVTDLPVSEFHRLFPRFEEKKAEGRRVSIWHVPPRHKYRHVIAMIHTPEGHSAWENLIYYPKLKNGNKSRGYKNTYKRQWWDKPAYTITKYTSRLGSQENGHPGRCIRDDGTEEGRIYSDARTMTIFELMRLSSLPDDWPLPENISTNLVREIIGEGVPPKLLESALLFLQELLNAKDQF